MIERFEVGKSYRWIGPETPSSLCIPKSTSKSWENGEPHKCTYSHKNQQEFEGISGGRWEYKGIYESFEEVADYAGLNPKDKMKRFTFRLFLIRKLIESLMASCIDEYAEFEDIADGLAKAHSAMEGKRKPDEDNPVDACLQIIGNGTCRGAIDIQCGIMIESTGRTDCFKYHCPVDTAICKKADGKQDVSVDAAKRWLAEHGIKE